MTYINTDGIIGMKIMISLTIDIVKWQVFLSLRNKVNFNFWIFKPIFNVNQEKTVNVGCCV